MSRFLFYTPTSTWEKGSILIVNTSLASSVTPLSAGHVCATAGWPSVARG